VRKKLKENKKETLSLKTKIIELQEDTNDIYMMLNMCILTNQTNLNSLKFTDEFINGVIENKSTYVGIPLVVNKLKLESGLYNNLTHELDKKTGQLKTATIGSFTDFWTDVDSDGSTLLMGSVKVYKRYPQVCEALIELYESGDLEMSCEVLVYGYESIENGVRSVAYKSGDYTNSLIGSAVVSDPAEVKSKATLLIAQALEHDLKGGENVPETIVFNKGNEIKYYGNLETSALTSSDISNQIYNALNPIDPKSNYRKYNYWVSKVFFAKAEGFDGHVIVEDWEDYEILWRIKFKIENDIVTLDLQVNWIEGYKGFIPKGVDIDSLIAEKEQQAMVLNSRINELENQKKEEIAVNEQEIIELQSQLETLQNQVKELEGTVVSQQEKIKGHEDKETELNSQIEELKPFKEKVEVAEKETKKNALVEKFTKLLSEETLKAEETQKAFEELNETALNSIVVSEVMSGKVAPKAKEGNVVVVASRQEDLIPQSLKDKLYAPKSE
jgi:predicted nuclease with TOPRIM domain